MHGSAAIVKQLFSDAEKPSDSDTMKLISSSGAPPAGGRAGMRRGPA
jgi:hypothetical protein